MFRAYFFGTGIAVLHLLRCAYMQLACLAMFVCNTMHLLLLLLQAEIYLHSIYSTDTAVSLGHSLTDIGVEVCGSVQCMCIAS
jgi:hypothetical protein